MVHTIFARRIFILCSTLLFLLWFIPLVDVRLVRLVLEVVWFRLGSDQLQQLHFFPLQLPKR
jgi:hypothetical protein